jgi:hypothetical protein
MKRKGNDSNPVGARNSRSKKPRLVADQSPAATHASIEHPVLSRLYPEVLSLRHYLLSRLPASSRSKSRRRNLSQLGIHAGHQDTAPRGIDLELAELLDTTLVGVVPNSRAGKPELAVRERNGDLESFTQEVAVSNGSAGTFKPGYFLQAEVSLAVLVVQLEAMTSSSKL